MNFFYGKLKILLSYFNRTINSRYDSINYFDLC